MYGNRLEKACYHYTVNETSISAFFERLEREIDHYGNRFAVLLLDLDQLKKINDRFGHAAGDRLLQQVSRILQGIVRVMIFRRVWAVMNLSPWFIMKPLIVHM